MSSFDIVPRVLNTSSYRYHNLDSGGFKVSSSRNSIKSEASLGIPELFPNTRRYVQWLFEQGIITRWRYYITKKITNALNVAPIEFFSPELPRRAGSKNVQNHWPLKKQGHHRFQILAPYLELGMIKRKIQPQQEPYWKQIVRKEEIKNNQDQQVKIRRLRWLCFQNENNIESKCLCPKKAKTTMKKMTYLPRKKQLKKLKTLRGEFK